MNFLAGLEKEWAVLFSIFFFYFFFMALGYVGVIGCRFCVLCNVPSMFLYLNMFLYVPPCFGNFWGTLTSGRLLGPCEQSFF
jgi:hypothetical protein